MTCRPLEPQPAFGVVFGHGANHQQLDLREGSLYQAIRVDDPERVLPRIEAAHLTDHRPGRVELEPREDRLPFTLADVSILRTQRIDRGRRHNRLAESYLGRCVACGTEDCSVIFLQIRLQESQNGSIRGREIDMAPPNPWRLVFDEVYEWGRLRIVDDDDVEIVVEVGGIRLVYLAISRFHLGSQARGRALERVVNRLRGIEERIRSGEDVPVYVQSKVLHERDDAVQEFGDTSAVGGRIHMCNPFPSQRFRKGLEFLVGRRLDD